MNSSDFFKLNWRDLVNGLLMSVSMAMIVAFQKLFDASGFNISLEDMKSVLGWGISAGLIYLVKNVFTDRNGDNPATEAVGKILKKT